MAKKVSSGSIRIKPGRGIIYLSRRSILSMMFLGLSGLTLVGALTMAGIPVVPMIWYRFAPGTSYALEEVLHEPVGFEEYLDDDRRRFDYQPPIDETLPPGNRIVMEKIGVDTAIIEKPIEEYEDAFRIGVWRVPDFGTAFERERPMILAAHRFGYLAWSNQYRKQNSFFNLPKLEVGDRITIIWEKRKYEYEIYASEEGEQISEYTADLILYTCKFLESPIRIFKYARLIVPGY